DHRWDADLEAGTLTFASSDDPDRTMIATARLLASIAPGPRSLMWSWALPQGDRSGVTERLRAYGDEHGISELTDGEVAFHDDTGDDLEEWMSALAQAVGGAAVGITGLSPYYSAPVEGARA